MKNEQDELLYEIEAIFYRHTETLTCGYMGLRCDENQSGDDNYKVIIKEILAKAKQHYEQKGLDRPELLMGLVVDIEEHLLNLEQGTKSDTIAQEIVYDIIENKLNALMLDIEEAKKEYHKEKMTAVREDIRELLIVAKKQEGERIIAFLTGKGVKADVIEAVKQDRMILVDLSDIDIHIKGRGT